MKNFKNFKVGDKVHHMELNKPAVSEVEAILVIEGELEFSYRKYKTESGEKMTVYVVGYSNYLEEKDCFKNIEDLKKSLFE